MKRCNECGKKKSLECFALDKRQTDGRFGKCKECQNKRQNKRRAVLRARKQGGHQKDYYDKFLKYRV